MGAPLANWIALASSVIAAVGLLFTGFQVWLLNQQARHDRRVVIDGVAVSWRPVEAPSRAEEPDGTSAWLYEVVLVNPGNLPIDDVHVHWTFPCPVVRVRRGGVRDAPTGTLVLSAPVVVGGGTRTWQRRVRFDYGYKERLIEVYAEVTFNDIEGRRRTNRWPRARREPLRRKDG
ncbi:hypothetical protein [Catenuloplanes atrovinosus]|uniref:Uncharacterized protein n=1 Tax=Catenuloplanes atrovinosus TaxID=137266 RepID=A0AAE3YM45_9ACTN|nr:hypothetical protein [Catenuloplanes atrovinosus]MDR7274846.1 hypothetical protein [Catenuloplanes atrovinosus]